MRAERDHGFTLLEVLVALLIAAIGLGALFQGSLGGLRAVDIAGRTEEAVSRARSRLATVAEAAPLVAEDRNGDDGGGYRWRTRVTPVATRRGGANDVGLALFAIEVTIGWGSGRDAREVGLATRRLGTLPPSLP